MIVYNRPESPRLSVLLRSQFVLQNERAEKRVNATPALNITADKERAMSLIPDTPEVPLVQAGGEP